MTAERKIKWTDQQAQAIAARGRNVLVTASAGTGKTAVLSGRCVSLVGEVDLCPNVLNMLVLTFTEAAAEQMRARIGQQLRDTYRQTHDLRLNRQLVLLQGADISTIHAFCKRLISENFHELSLDPAFRIIDADEAMLLKAEVLDETIEWAWRQAHLVPALRGLLRRRDLRDSGGFLAGVIRLHEFLDGVASRDRWCDLAERLAEADDLISSELGAAQKEIVRDRLDTILAQLHAAHRIYEEEAPGGKWAAALAADVIAPIAACRDRLSADDWQECAKLILDTKIPQAARLTKFPEKLGELLKDLRKTAVKSFAGLGDLAIINPDYMDAVGRATSAQSHVLVELVRKFARLYAQRKATLNGLDFADLEHHALKLLTSETDRGDTQPSEAALTLRQRYKYIFVDEYQDINPVQQAILDALGSGDNVFVVGDVKQSIYAWRGAEPTIFLERLRQSADAAELSHGLRVDLNYNFRSARGILDFVNKVFCRIMTASLAHVDYDDTARLRSGVSEAADASTGSDAAPIVELHILDEKADDQSGRQESNGADATSEDLDLIRPRQRQAALIAQRIGEMVGAEPGSAAMQIPDKETGNLRDVQYRDIVVLMRSLAKKANDYVEIFRLAGIPVSCDATAGYFETTEISDVLCLLKVLDNPQRDIELAAVLRSPFFGFGETDLASIRLAGREKSPQANFYTSATLYAENGADALLQKKLASTFDTLERWRRLARRGHLADLLWRIYRDTQYLAFVCALPNGQARKANLLKLHDRAVQFEGFASSTGVPSLTRFVAFVEKLQEAGQDWAPAEPAAAAGNAVRILSVHKSKGLEFPVVFLAELESEFNQRDVQDDLVADTDHALGLRIVDPASNSKLRSLAHQVIGEKKRAVTLAEEMRILYVALTRAKDRLIVTASQKRTDCGKVLLKGVLLADAVVPDWLLKTCKNPLEWLLYGLADQRCLHEAFETGQAERTGAEGLFDLTVHRGEALHALSQRVQRLRERKKRHGVKATGKSPAGARSRQLLAQLKDDLGWEYAFGAAVREPAKQSVTVLTHRDDEFARIDHARALERRPLATMTTSAKMRGGPSGRLIGTAAHLVIASLDLTQPITRAAIERVRDALVGEGAMTPAVGDAIDVEAIGAFFDSELGAVVLDQANTVWREWPFTFGLPAPLQAAPDRDAQFDEIVVVQGIIDLLVRTPDGLLVIDFKSDRVTDANLDERANTYRGQLDLYAEAAAEILSCAVQAKWLYFLVLRQAVPV
ncbi:MAG: helicase-exonuclease AddAB subunit AddA [Phycisphaerales bacterium]|nr:MAG: helicase-exonuclease AddAB subunit AddA [Phycisphaerales bacterium]